MSNNWVAIFKVKVIARVHIIKILPFLPYLLKLSLRKVSRKPDIFNTMDVGVFCCCLLLYISSELIILSHADFV